VPALCPIGREAIEGYTSKANQKNPEDEMNSHMAGRQVVRRVLCYSALIVIVSAFSLLDFAHSSICWGATINVATTDNLQTLVNNNPGSTTFSLAPGIHRLQSVIPKTGNAFVGQTGAILSGAALLTTFTQTGPYWTSHVSVTQAASYPGLCNPSSPACIYPEDLFFNSVPKTRVNSLAAVGHGSWYLDYGTGTAYMEDNPAGDTVEISELPYAIAGAASSVLISNLTIEKYACVAQSGAVGGAGAGASWAIEYSEIRYNHGRGISTGNGMWVYENLLHNNGQLGIGGAGTNFTVQSNQLYNNNFAGYSFYWEAGGAKFCNAITVVIRYNYSYNNGGPGLWNDINSEGITYDENETYGNVEAGILSEISTNITISGNYIFDDGFNPSGTGPWWGAGILIVDSSTVSVYSNTVVNCINGIVGVMESRGDAPNGQPYAVENVSVEGNTITQATGTAAGIVIDGSGITNAVFTSMNNVFLDNTYNLGVAGGDYLYWMGEPMPLANFVAYF
jgi:hypothetical protein